MPRFGGIPIEETPSPRFGMQAPPVEFSAGEMVSNIPSSGKQFATDIVQPFIHPVETARAVGNLAMGGIDKAAHKLTDALPADVVASVNRLNNWMADMGAPLERQPEQRDQMEFPREQYADQMGKFIMDRYGSMDNFKQTVMRDPVGVLADASTVLMGTGAALRSGKLSRLGAAVEPVNVATNTAKAASKLLPRALPAKLYESAAKFGTTIPKAKRAKMVQTALDKKIPPTGKGVDRLSGMINALDDTIDGMVAAAGGKLIPKEALFTHLKELRKKMGGAKVEGAKDLRVIDKIAKSIDEHLKASGKSFLTPEELQRFKQDAYKKINFDRKQGKARIAKEETFKATARSAKEAVERAVPGVSPLNRQLGDLLDIRDPIQRSANRIDNLNVTPLTAPLNVGAGTAIAGPVGTAAGGVASILEMPKVKSALAIALNAAQKQALADILLNNSIPLAATRDALFQAGRLQSQ